MRDDEFEWDDRKARSNLRKHGISFEVARRAFNDHAAIDRLDDSEDYGEERYLLIGEASGRLVAVIYTLRGTHTRIISARKAELDEQEDYHA